MIQLLLVVLALHLTACGASSSKATGPTQNCDVRLAEEPNQTSAPSGATVGNTTFQCGPTDSPNRQKNLTVPPEEPA